MAKFKIDKSVLDEAEREQLEALLAKAAVDPEAAEEEMEDEVPPVKPAKKAEGKKAEGVDAKKSADFEAAMQAANERMDNLQKSIEMKEFTEIAKKYAPLGEKEEDLAKNLYEMKKSNEGNYNAYISVLDKSLDLVNKSGLFVEIGKSAGAAPSGAVAKAEAKAQDIMKSKNVDYDTALAEAWEDPDLMAEYDAEYTN